jgi:hypothetical protein
LVKSLRSSPSTPTTVVTGSPPEGCLRSRRPRGSR